MSAHTVDEGLGSTSSSCIADLWQSQHFVKTAVHAGNAQWQYHHPHQLVRVIAARDGDEDRGKIETVKLTSAGASNRLQNYSACGKAAPAR